MRIKHFMGYGSVNAKVVGKSLNTATGLKTLTINVWGNHEWGLDRSEYYDDVNDWLVKKVAKVEIDYRKIESIECNYIPNIDGQEAVQYHITYKEGR